MLCGLLPFGSVFIELFFIFNVSSLSPQPMQNVTLFSIYTRSFRFLGFVESSNLLSVRISLHCLYHPHYQLCSGRHRSHLLPTMQ